MWRACYALPSCPVFRSRDPLQPGALEGTLPVQRLVNSALARCACRTRAGAEQGLQHAHQPMPVSNLTLLRRTRFRIIVYIPPFRGMSVYKPSAPRLSIENLAWELGRHQIMGMKTLIEAAPHLEFVGT